jgi:hypothetical protein
MELRLEPDDEYMHELGPEPTFNESMYFNAIDPGSQLGVFVRLGNRANEGRGEMTCCVYLPDGRVAFMFQRPEVRTNDAFDAAGMRFEVARPFEELSVRYDGTVVVLDDPLEMAEPRRAFTEHAPAPCTIALTYQGVCPPVGGEPETTHERPGEEFARGHYEQLVSATGSITVDDEEWAMAGFGLRDHSWGPRTWQAPWYYRWLTANFGAEFGFMASRIARRDSDGFRGGFVWDGEEIVPTQGTTVRTDWTTDGSYHRTVDVEFRSAKDGDDRSWQVHGEVLNLIPLRNHRNGAMTRISEGLTRWTSGDRVGFGLSEYLDQIVDGLPVGTDE